MDPVYLYLHIPRTGGTTIEYSVSYFADRTNDRYLKHYNYTQSYTDTEYDYLNIPKLSFRTTEQQNNVSLCPDTAFSVIVIDGSK